MDILEHVLLISHQMRSDKVQGKHLLQVHQLMSRKVQWYTRGWIWMCCASATLQLVCTASVT